MPEAAKNPADRVDHPVEAYNRMKEAWALPEALIGGTRAMRKAGITWLPKEEKESADSYSERLGRSVLYGGYADTIEKLVSKPFSKPVKIEGDDTLDERLQELQRNTDRCGHDLTAFARELMEDGLVYGKLHFLVDHPPMPAGRERTTVAEDRQSDRRPYFVRVKPTALVGWRGERLSDGREVLSQVRIMESATKPEGLYGEKTVKRVRVYGTAAWELWELDDVSQTWSIVDQGPNTLGEVPLVTVYFRRTGMLESEPPMEDLAWLNLKHWISDSDQSHILHVARVPILFASGFTEDDPDIVIGAGRAARSENVNAKLMYVEHTGAAIKSGADDVRRIEERMEILGLQPMLQDRANSTATEHLQYAEKEQSNLQSWIRLLERGLEEGYSLAARWIAAKVPEGFQVQIHSEFGLALQAVDLAQLVMMRQARLITHETFLNEVKRRGILGDELDVAAEIESTGSEEPDLSDMGPETGGFGGRPGRGAPFGAVA